VLLGLRLAPAAIESTLVPAEHVIVFSAEAEWVTWALR
jgi:hypothetical protein